MTPSHAGVAFSGIASEVVWGPGTGDGAMSCMWQTAAAAVAGGDHGVGALLFIAPCLECRRLSIAWERYLTTGVFCLYGVM